MANNKEEYTSEFKAKVALQALARSKKNLDNLAEKYDVPVSVILTWAVQLERNAEGVFEHSTPPEDVEYEPTPVNIEVIDADISKSMHQGVMSDDLDYKKLLRWSLLGLVLVIIFSRMLVEMFQIKVGEMPEQVVGEKAYYEVTQKKQEAKKRLSSFGVVNTEENVYRVPVDMVIEQMAEDAQPDTIKDKLLEKIDPTPVEQ